MSRISTFIGTTTSGDFGGRHFTAFVFGEVNAPTFGVVKIPASALNRADREYIAALPPKNERGGNTTVNLRGRVCPRGLRVWVEKPSEVVTTPRSAQDGDQ
jgi:hypothetical protein